MRFLSSIAFGSILAAAAALSMPASATDMRQLQNNPLDIGAYIDDLGPIDLMQTTLNDTLDGFDTGGLAADSALEVAAVFDGQGGDDVIIGKIDALNLALDGGTLVHEAAETVPITLGHIGPKFVSDDYQAPEVASLADDVGADSAHAKKAAGDV